MFILFQGDLAKKEIYSTLYSLFRDKLLPEKTIFIGFARSKLDIKEYLKVKIVDKIKIKPGEEKIYDEFVSRNHYLSGQYDSKESFIQLNSTILDLTKDLNQNEVDCNRIFYLALPPTVYKVTTENISKYCKAKEYVKISNCVCFT